MLDQKDQRPKLKAMYPSQFGPDCDLLKKKIRFQMQPGNLKAHEQAVSSVAFHRVVQVMATASADGSFKVFTSHSSA